MSAYNPPLQFLSIFNQNEYLYGSEAITLDYVNSHFLKLAGGTLTGALLCNNSLTCLANIYANSGSVSLPSYSFSGDSNSGIYRIGANNLAVACDGAKVLDIATTGLTVTGNVIVDQIALDNSSITFSGVSAANIIAIPASLADAFSIKQGATSYLKFDTSSLAITLGQNTIISGSLGVNSLVIDQIALDASTVTFSGLTGTNIISIPDNYTTALTVKENANAYMDFRTSNGAEKIILYQNTDILASLVANSLTVDSLSLNGSNITFGSVTTAENTITIIDNLADSFSFVQGAAKYLTFKTTNSAEAVIIGKDLTLSGQIIATSSSLLYHILYRSTGTATDVVQAWGSDFGGSLVAQCRANGNIYNVNGVYGTASDSRIKRDVLPSTEKHLDKIKKLKLHKFKLKSDVSGEERLGLIAQEVELIYPDLVEESSEIALDEDGNEFFVKSIKQSLLIYRLLAAVQELGG